MTFEEEAEKEEEEDSRLLCQAFEDGAGKKRECQQCVFPKRSNDSAINGSHKGIKRLSRDEAAGPLAASEMNMLERKDSFGEAEITYKPEQCRGIRKSLALIQNRTG